MANKIDAELSGCGTVLQVVSAWFQQCDDDTLADSDLKCLKSTIEGLQQTDLGKQALLSICAAVLNQQFERSGLRLSVFDGCKIDFDYEPSYRQRQITAAMMFD